MSIERSQPSGPGTRRGESEQPDPLVSVGHVLAMIVVTPAIIALAAVLGLGVGAVTVGVAAAVVVGRALGRRTATGGRSGRRHPRAVA